MVQLIVLVWCASWSLTSAYPIESKPLNNNPDTWNFGDGWLYFNPRNSADPSAAALIGGDPHVKKSKITPKSIFIAPSSYTGNEQLCPHGFRVDDNGKCIKTVTINQDEILAARISELFGIDESPNKNSDIDSDYYDFDDESKSEKDSGPLQINLPLALDMDDDDDSKKVEYVVERFSVRNLDPKLVTTTTERPEETTAPATETTTESAASTEEPSTSSTPSPTEADDESGATVTESLLPISSTVKDDDDEIALLSTLPPTTVEPITSPSTTTTPEPSTTTSTSTSTTATSTTVAPVKIFSVDFLPKSQRKSNRMGQASARLKNSRDRDKTERPRKQKTTVASVSSSEMMTKLLKLDKEQIAKKNRTRTKRRKLTTTTTELITESPVTTTQKPFWWLPKGWSIDESKEKPVLVRFWAQQPLKQDERARSHNASRQRVNSRMPSDNIFREVSAPEYESLMKK